jgi:hypothetical protein
VPSGHEHERIETLASTLLGSSFRLTFELAIKPTIDEWKSDLCYNLSLSEGQRLGLQHALLALERGLSDIFKKAGVDLPEWIEKEFNFKDE